MVENEKLIKSYEDAIDCLKKNKPTSGFYMLQESVDMAIKALEEIQQYRAIGTVEECRAAVKKQAIGKPIYNDKCTCPSCYTHNEVWEKRRNTVGSDIVYCWHCGQAVEIKKISCESEEKDTAEYGKEHPEWAEKIKQLAYKQEE